MALNVGQNLFKYILRYITQYKSNECCISQYIPYHVFSLFRFKIVKYDLNSLELHIFTFTTIVTSDAIVVLVRVRNYFCQQTRDGLKLTRKYLQSCKILLS